MNHSESDTCTYKEAAMMIGCDHHYVRALVKQDRIRVVATEMVNDGVERKLLSRYDVESYVDAHRVRKTYRLRMTDEEHRAVMRTLESMRR